MPEIDGVWYDDEEDYDEEAAAERRPRRNVQAWGESRIADGDEGDDLLKRMARSHAEGMMEVVLDVAYNGTKDAARLGAAKEVFARGFGMPKRLVEQKVDVKITDQRAAHYAALQELAKDNPAVDYTDAEFQDVEPAAPKALTKRRILNDDE